jgi:hypothetical protein
MVFDREGNAAISAKQNEKGPIIADRATFSGERDRIETMTSGMGAPAIRNRKTQPFMGKAQSNYLAPRAERREQRLS